MLMFSCKFMKKAKCFTLTLKSLVFKNISIFIREVMYVIGIEESLGVV